MHNLQNVSAGWFYVIFGFAGIGDNLNDFIELKRGKRVEHFIAAADDRPQTVSGNDVFQRAVCRVNDYYRMICVVGVAENLLAQAQTIILSAAGNDDVAPVCIRREQPVNTGGWTFLHPARLLVVFCYDALFSEVEYPVDEP
jgi:hypothetical protein